METKSIVIGQEYHERLSEIINATQPKPTIRSLVEYLIEQELERRGLTPKKRRPAK